MARYDKFRFWCQKVLPLVYDDSLSYYEVLCKAANYINKLIEDNKIFADDVEQLRIEMDEAIAWVERVNADVLGEKIIFVGDSYGTNSRSSPWTDVFVERAGLNSDQYINVCQGGIGWSEGENGRDFLDRLETAYQNCQLPPYSWTPSEVTKIIVAGGVFRDLVVANFDFDALSTIVNEKVSAFMSYAKANFPNAKVYYAYCSACLNTGREGAGNLTWQEMINSAYSYYYSAAEYGYILLPNIQYVLMQNYRIDTQELGMLHPSGLGGQALGTAIHNAVYGSWFDIISSNINVIKGDDNTSANCRIRMNAENNNVILTFRDSANVTIDSRADATYVLATLPDRISQRNAINTFDDVVGTAFATGYNTTENTRMNLPVRIFGDGLNLCAYAPDAYWKGCDSITIYPFTLNCERRQLFRNYLGTI